MRKFLSVAVTAACAVLSLGATVLPAAASAEPVLTTGSAGGTAVAVDDLIQGNLASATTASFATASGGAMAVTCSASSLSLTATMNPTSPGTADLNLTTWSFTSCATSITPGE